jgi:hypothetical protein
VPGDDRHIDRAANRLGLEIDPEPDIADCRLHEKARQGDGIVRSG